jgi:hypothetical protein
MCIKFVIKTSLYYDARSEKHKKKSNIDFNENPLNVTPVVTFVEASGRKDRAVLKSTQQ